MLEGLARDEVFTVVHEQVMTDTARFADVVLPATTHFEVDDVTRSYGSFTRHDLPAVIDRVGESRTNNEFAAALAARLGLDPELFPTHPARCSTASLPGGAEVTHRLRGQRPCNSGTRNPTRGRARLAGIDEIDVPRYRPLDERLPA